jgi:ribonuclease Y
VGLILALVAVQAFGATGVGKARRLHRQLVEDAEREAEAVRREAQIESREQAVALRAEIDKELADRREGVLKIEERVLAKEEEIERKLLELGRKDQGLADRETHLRQLQEDMKQAKSAQQQALERIAGMTLQEAKAYLLERGEELVRHDLARRVRMLEEEARAESKRRARNLVADALQRVAASHAAETTVSVVELPTDDMKGRIIGREGRNIRALEHLTGVDFIIDDTPHAVVLSSFDGLRREIARLTLSKLIEDGRIHPARIEETYYQSKAELEEIVRQAGEQAVFEANCGPFHEEIVKILGRLRFRTSYGQNVLKHTLEVVHLAGIMATELGASVKTAKRAAVLHDLGKALTHEIEGSHAAISAQLARRYGETQHVVHAIEAHH